MSTMLIANNCTRESGSFCGDQLCSLKAAYLMVANAPDVDRVIMSVSPGNEMHFLWEKFIDDPRGNGSIPPVEVVPDNWNPGNWEERWAAWTKWRIERKINDVPFDHYRELYLRIHGAQRQRALCGSERGLGRRNIYEYWYYGQENAPNDPPHDVEEWDNHGVPTTYSFGEGLIYHPPHRPVRDVYVSPHAKTQGNVTFTFEFWADVVHRLVDAGATVTVGFNGGFCEELNGHPCYKKHWGDHRQWMEQVCQHKIVACGNTGTGWLAAAAGVPMVTMEPPGSQMPDHRYRECGLRNIVELVDTPSAARAVDRILEEVQRCIVMTTGCYDILHAGHVRHLERCRAMGTKLIVAMNSDKSVRKLKGETRPINPENQRKAVLEALRSVDEVRVVDEPMDLVRTVRPDVLAVGYGYTMNTMVGRDFVESYGGRALITCNGDAKDDPTSTTKIEQRIRVADVVDACRVGASSSVNPFEKLRLIADQLLTVRHLPGDVADLGSYRGGCAYVLRRLVPDKHLHLFDTWAGTPIDDPLCHHKRGEWVASLDECRKLVGEGELTHYHQGVFPVSAPLDAGGGGGRIYSFVYIDMDTYQATKDALAFFWPRVVPGGKIVVDDWLWLPCAGVEKAVREAFVDGAIREFPQLWTCVMEKR